jgi:hypothetical protein
MWNCFTERVTSPGFDSTKRILKIENALTRFDARIQFRGPVKREQIFRKAPSNNRIAQVRSTMPIQDAIKEASEPVQQQVAQNLSPRDPVIPVDLHYRQLAACSSG